MNKKIIAVVATVALLCFAVAGYVLLQKKGGENQTSEASGTASSQAEISSTPADDGSQKVGQQAAGADKYNEVDAGALGDANEPYHDLGPADMALVQQLGAILVDVRLPNLPMDEVVRKVTAAGVPLQHGTSGNPSLGERDEYTADLKGKGIHSLLLAYSRKSDGKAFLERFEFGLNPRGGTFQKVTRQLGESLQGKVTRKGKGYEAWELPDGLILWVKGYTSSDPREGIEYNDTVLVTLEYEQG